MVGVLTVSFCERQSDETSLCIDLWSYPDGSCNLIVVASSELGRNEIVFPCNPKRLSAVLLGAPAHYVNESGAIYIDKCGDNVCAEFDSFEGLQASRQCIPERDYREAMESLLARSAGYLV